MSIDLQRHKSQRRPRGRSAQSEAGFSLVEVVVAMGILVVASLAVANSTISSLAAVDQSESTLQIESAVRETMESIGAVSMRDLDTLDGVQLYTHDNDRPFLIRVRVSEVNTLQKAVEVLVFEKAKDDAGEVIPGRRIFSTMTYRSERG